MEIRPKSALLAVLSVILPLAGHATRLEMPADAMSVSWQAEVHGSYELPMGPWLDGRIETVPMTGMIVQQVWKLPDAEATTLRTLSPLREQLGAAGYNIPFECADADCGGFDFRFGTRIALEPDMYVDLGDFRFLSARRGEDEALSIVVSRSSMNGYLQIVHVSPGQDGIVELTSSTKSPDTGISAYDSAGGIATLLETGGSAVLGGLSFATGSSALEGGDFRSLHELAAYLRENPANRVILVGHTDAKGSLEGNIALSRQRAEAVMQRMIEEYEVPPDRFGADGMCYLSPGASNLSDDGRAMNRRVEAVLIIDE